MKVLTFSRHFPAGHPKKGEPTYFVEKVWNYFRDSSFALPDSFIHWTDNYATLLPGDEYLKSIAIREVKHHTIRAGNRFKPGDMASLRVWSDKPYRSKQIEFAQVEVKKVWSIEIWLRDRITIGLPEIPGIQLRMLPLCVVAQNDGLDCSDFEAWFKLHPKKNGKVFRGQIICWNESINYGDIEY